MWPNCVRPETDVTTFASDPGTDNVVVGACHCLPLIVYFASVVPNAELIASAEPVTAR